MSIAEIRTELHNKIDSAGDEQVNEIYGLILNYLNSTFDYSEWDSLSEAEKQRTEQSIAEAKAGHTKPLSVINKRLIRKYNLNG